MKNKEYVNRMLYEQKESLKTIAEKTGVSEPDSERNEILSGIKTALENVCDRLDTIADKLDELIEVQGGEPEGSIQGMGEE